MKLTIVTPFGQMLKAACEELVIPGYNGQIGLLPAHIPMVTEVPPGLLWFRHEGKTELLAVSQGYAEIHDDDVTLLVETAERAEDIDVARAEANRVRFAAKVAADDGPQDIPESRLIRTKLRREEARIEVAGMGVKH